MIKPDKNLLARYRIIKGNPYIINGHDIFQLDDVGILIWENINGENDIEKIISIVSNKFSVSIEEIKVDITSFIEELHSNKLIEY
ncbi:PqqD family protein [Bacillus sp. 1A]|uniref:PqqD family protein n=1 Tax=Bacillus sp. 1A TaxID=3461399 RepID=UPI00404455B3